MILATDKQGKFLPQTARICHSLTPFGCRSVPPRRTSSCKLCWIYASPSPSATARWAMSMCSIFCLSERVHHRSGFMPRGRFDAKAPVGACWCCPSSVYARPKPVRVEIDVLLKRLIYQGYARHPFHGSRKMVVYLGRRGHRVKRKRAQRPPVA